MSSAKSAITKRIVKAVKAKPENSRLKGVQKGVAANAATSKAMTKTIPALKSARPAAKKAKARTPRSDAFEAIHSAAAALHSVGVIDKQTMRNFDASCLSAPCVTAYDVVRIRQKMRVSQEVLAHYLGITKSTVVKWESAANTPSPMAQRLLNAIDKHGIDVIA
jgi:putative transcriptional regulator